MLAGLMLMVTSAFAQWSLYVTCQTYPSPSVSDWENQPGIVRISIGYSGAGIAKVQLQSSITSTSSRLEIASGVSDTFVFTIPRTIQTDNRNFLSYHDIKYNSQYRSEIIQTNQLPEGAYVIHVALVNAAGAILTSAESNTFYILSFHRPTLQSPQAGDTIRSPFPTFQWTNATTFPGFSVAYKFTLWEVKPEYPRMPLQIIREVPYYQTTVMNEASFTYPNSAPPLEVGQSFVWQVQATDNTGRPLGEDQGYSDPGGFFRASMGILHGANGDTSRFQSLLNVNAQSTVVRMGSWYDVSVVMTFPSSATDIDVRVWNQGFQCCTGNSNIGDVYSEGDSAMLSVYHVHVAAPASGGGFTAHYLAVPIVTNSTPPRDMCESLAISYELGASRYSGSPDPGPVSKVITDVYSEALRQVHHLSLTVPKSLYAWYDRSQVDSLLNWVGKLEVQRNGAVAYVEPSTDPDDVRRWLRHDGLFGAQLALDWAYPSGPNNPGGYLLIVGEDNIVWYWVISGFSVYWSNTAPTTVVDHADFPWGDPDGDNIPNLAVGRILGRTAEELTRSIKVACLPSPRPATFPALLISGLDPNNAYCQWYFDMAVTGGAYTLKTHGCSVDMTYMTAESTDALRRAVIQQKCNGQQVVLFTGHGNVNVWNCFSNTDVPGVQYDGVNNPIFIGFTCLSGFYPDNTSIARAFLVKNGTRNFIGSTQDSPVTVNSDLTSFLFWPGFWAQGRQSPGTGLFSVQYNWAQDWSSISPYEQLARWEYNVYGDPW
jgi:hypothetical protein